MIRILQPGPEKHYYYKKEEKKKERERAGSGDQVCLLLSYIVLLGIAPDETPVVGAF